MKTGVRSYGIQGLGKEADAELDYPVDQWEACGKGNAGIASFK